MENTIKRDLCQELDRLLTQKNNLATNPNATQRDYSRLDYRIDEICGLLFTIEREEATK